MAEYEYRRDWTGETHPNRRPHDECYQKLAGDGTLMLIAEMLIAACPIPGID